jgi:Zinc carboxypeptidase
VLHGAEDRRKLEANGFDYTVEIADLAARTEANRRADRRFQAEVEQTALPSGRTSYRRLADYEAEMKLLALQYPGMVRPFTLPHKSVLGRDVNGIEIARNAVDLNDGKPIFLNMGVHHAREWPSSEHAMEWAYDLLTNYGTSARTTRLVEATRNIVIPIVNVDGFNISREAAPRGDFSLFDYEMKRKNCDISDNTPAQYRTGTCDNNPAGRLRGTDPNRNYGGFWGGPGASTNWSSDTYRGDAPFSEPEIQNIRELQATRTITNLITNHTYSNLVLRPPGVADVGFPLDEPVYEALGARMADHNGYSNIPSFGLYDTTGSTEDWTFWTAGSLGFTFEIGPDEFHPPFEQGVVDEYLGRGDTAGAGKGGNREAYYEMLASTADTALHSRITGTAPPGSTLTISKSFQTSTSPVIQPNGSTGDSLQFGDTLSYSYAPQDRRFDWAVNPSTRPVVAGRFGRDAVAPPQGQITLANPPGVPAENTGNPEAGPHEEVSFTVGGPPEVDNGKMTVHMEWTSTSTDWDLYILDENGAVVTQSAAGGTREENAVLFDPPPGTYRAIIVNYDGGATDDWSNGNVTFASPRPTTYGEKEAWTLTCTSADGAESRPLQVFVDRGERREVGNACKRAKQ